MLKIVGKNKENIEEKELLEKREKYEKTCVDIGTGDGNYIYKNALKNPKTLYIGIEPSYKQLEKFSKKAQRKKLENLIFLVGSIEQMPFSDENFADEITILYPWGSLLQKVIVPTDEFLSLMHKMLKKEGILKMVFGYSKEIEPKETERLELPELDQEFVNDVLVRKYTNFGFKHEIKNLQDEATTWGKKLKNFRDFYYIEFTK